MSDPYLIGLRDYGWMAVLMLFMIKDVWPWFRDHVFPQARQERMNEAKRKADQELRQTKALEAIAEATNQININNALTSERLATLANLLGEHDRYTRDSVQEMFRMTGITPRRRRTDRKERKQ